MLQVIAAIISAAVPVDGGRGWTSFGLLLFELNLIVWAGGTPCSISAILPPQKVHMCILTKCRTVPSISSLLNAKMCCASAGYYSDRNAGNAIKELEVRCALPHFHTLQQTPKVPFVLRMQACMRAGPMPDALHQAVRALPCAPGTS